MCTLLSRFLWPRRGRGALVLLAAMAMVALLAHDAAAQPTILDTHVPFTFAGGNSCTGEFFSGSGFYHQKITFEPAPNFHFSLEINFENAQATTMSGVRYVWNSQEAVHTILDTDSAPANQTFELVLHFIRQGEDGAFVAGDDFYLREAAHFTVNANGDFTASFSDIRGDCK